MKKSELRKISYTKENFDPYNTGFLIALPLVGFIGLWAHIHYEGFKPELFLYAFALYVLTIFTISAGYHRLFSHRAYKANKWVKMFFLFFGAVSGESTALKWCSDHRVHHKKVDTNDDPYNIHQGFFYAHMGWVMLKESVSNENNYAKDLTNDPLVMWQHNNIIPLTIGSNIAICLLIGWLTGSYIGAFAIVGFLRLTFVLHVTFCINSLCHMIGSRPYDLNQTARDSHLLAIITFGEAYHNYHHAFQLDYRNGHLWYCWDPTKWILNVTTWFGWTWDLKRASEAAVLKAKMNVQQTKVVHQVGLIHSVKEKMHEARENLEEMKAKVHEAQKQWLDLKKEYAKKKFELRAQGEQKLEEYKIRIEQAKREFKESYEQWLLEISALKTSGV